MRIKLEKEYETIQKKLIDANKDKSHPNSDYNKFVEHHAKMIAEGLQLLDELHQQSEN